MIRITQIGVFPTDRKVLHWVHPETLNYIRDYISYSLAFLPDFAHMSLSDSIYKMENLLLSKLKIMFYNDIYIEEFHCTHDLFLDEENADYNNSQTSDEKKFYCIVFYVSVVPNSNLFL